MRNLIIIVFAIFFLLIVLKIIKKNNKINKKYSENLETDILTGKLNSYNLIYVNEKNEPLNNLNDELNEQLLAEKYINPDDVVLELGARYGTVTCIISKKLNNKNNLISVEPDSSIWNTLEKNLSVNKCNSNIVKGFISNKPLSLNLYGYASTQVVDPNSTIPNYTLDQIKNKYNVSKFTALIVDCEGCMESFLNENPDILSSLRLIMFEKDYPDRCDYDAIKLNLIKNNFKPVEEDFHEVWIKK
jgi:FkbM family methyltransferase